MSWWDNEPMLPFLTVYEAEESRPVIYDHKGQPYYRPKAPIGFIDPNNPPKAVSRRIRIKDQS